MRNFWGYWMWLVWIEASNTRCVFSKIHLVPLGKLEGLKIWVIEFSWFFKVSAFSGLHHRKQYRQNFSKRRKFSLGKGIFNIFHKKLWKISDKSLQNPLLSLPSQRTQSSHPNCLLYLIIHQILHIISVDDINECL